MDFGRVITAMVTPFREDMSLDLEAARRLAAHLATTGSDGIVVAGTTGESPVLSREEKVELFRAVKDAVGGRVKVIAGTGSNDTRGSIELTREAERVGVDGVMLVVPYYNRPSQQGLYEHFRAIATSTSLPVMLYNVPSRTGRNLEPDTVVRLSELTNVVALKEAAGDMDQVSKLKASLKREFVIYSGDDSLTLPMLALGCRGVVSVASHLVGTRIKDMILAYEQGDGGRALDIHLSLFPLFKALFVTTNPVPVKE
ncbi:MAG: 4-hydroxy-tetrahydrodipicolinate synthase, partial [Clostridia bacterium]|nr:4-hydroxy-tetrahydrodipicolinate synthase [Clostridia bacterium]